ncbi:MAG: trypsin-like serine protease [Polyangiaceae bacterium]
MNKYSRLGGVCLLAAAGCQSVNDESSEDIAQVDQAIFDAAEADDTSNFTVQIRNPLGNGKEARCDGVLITPVWVLTAKHCITGVNADPVENIQMPNGTNTTLTVLIPPKGSSTIDESDPNLMVRKSVEIDTMIPGEDQVQLQPMGDNKDVARELALVKLDFPVPMAKSFPLHINRVMSDNAPKCSDEAGVDKTISGFNGGKTRFTNTFDGYHRDAEKTGNLWPTDPQDLAQNLLVEVAVYTRDWEAPVGLLPGLSIEAAFSLAEAEKTLGYKGIEQGDSGGPLFEANDPAGNGAFNENVTLCGIASSTHMGANWDNFVCFPGGCLALRQRHTAVDSEGALRFLRQHILVPDAFGEIVFEGECSATPNANVDANLDGIVDACQPDVDPNGDIEIECQPWSCKELEKTCGVWDDGCNGHLVCGDLTCPGTVDDAEPPCFPRTCKDLDKTCGVWDDGCGGHLVCGALDCGPTGDVAASGGVKP